MKKSLVLPALMAGQLMAGQALAQGSGNVTVFRMSGPQLGVRLEEVDKDAVTRLRLKEEKGALVAEVVALYFRASLTASSRTALSWPFTRCLTTTPALSTKKRVGNTETPP